MSVNEKEKLYVRFCNYPELYPIEVLDVVKLRSRGLLSVRAFRREMRRYGISFTKALILQGCYERGEYEVVTEEMKEIPKKEVENKLVVNVYRFVWMLKMKYLPKKEDPTKKKEHPVEIELVVVGKLEKHKMSSRPTESQIEDKLANELEMAFLEYLKDYWHIVAHKINISVVFDEYTPSLEEFEKIDEKLKDISEPLEGSVDYIEFKLRRSPYGDFVEKEDYASDLYPYVEYAVNEVEEWITYEETIVVKEEIKKAVERVSELIRKRKLDVIRDRIRKAKNITDVEDVYKTIYGLWIEGKITEKEYYDFLKLLEERAKVVLRSQADKWISRIRKCKSLSELDKVMWRIQQTKTWQSRWFEPMRPIIEEEEKKVRNKLLSELIRKRKERKEVVYRRIYRYFENRMKEIVKTTKNVRDLERLIRRVEKSKLPEEMKRRLIRKIRKEIRKIQREQCKYAWNSLRELEPKKEMSLDRLEKIEKGLRGLWEDIRSKPKNFEPCREYVIKEIRKRLERIRYYKKRSFLTELREELNRVLRLSPEEQAIKFRELIETATTLDELNEIERAFRKSPLYLNPKYDRYRVQIEALIRVKRGQILYGGK